MSKKALIASLSAITILGGTTGVCLGVPKIRENIKTTISQIKNNKKDDSTINNNQSNLSISKEEYENIIKENNQLKSDNDTLKKDNESLIADNNNLSNSLLESNNSLTNSNNALSNANNALLERDESISGLLNDKENLQKQLDNALSSERHLSQPEKLIINNYNGTWYLNGTFEDYYIIKDGVVTKGANVDRGILSVMFEQMYLIFNSGDMIPITLSDNGIKFITDDGKTYTNYYLTYAENAKPQMAYICGSYNNADVSIDLNSDNLIKYTKDNITLYGAYTVSAVRKNIGGNFTYIQQVNATINESNGTVTKRTFTIVNNGDLVEDTGTVYHSLIKENTIIDVDDKYKTDCFKFTVIFDKPIDVASLKAKGATQLAITAPFYYSRNISPSIFINGVGATKNAYVSQGFIFTSYISLENCCDTLNTFTFYLSNLIDVKGWCNSLVTFYNDDCSTGFGSFGYSVIDFKRIGTTRGYNSIPNDIKSIESYEFYKDCSSVTSYVNGSYQFDNTTLTILDDDVTISTSETIEDAVVKSDTPADSITIVAKTDGTNIVQTVTIKYTFDGTIHTIIFDITNNSNNVSNSKVDNASKTIVKI